tara:strand:- start:91 stop:480 length:390 start_codon:yes stop_codon:yes gene_type:complete
MSESGKKKLQRLGYKFWSAKFLNKEPLFIKEKEIFYLLGERVLVAGNLDEFSNYLRFVPSISRVLGMTDLDIKDISKKEALERDFNLVIHFIQDLSIKSKKTLKFDSLKLLMNDMKLKKHLYSEIRDLT